MAADLERLLENFTLTETEEQVIEVQHGDEETDRVWLVGKVLSHKSLNLNALATAFNGMWRVNKGFKIQEGGDGRFICELGSKRDKQKILKERPWSFDRNLVVLEELADYERPLEISLNHCPFWIRLYDLPMKFRTAKVLCMLGSQIGEFLHGDEETVEGIGQYVRIRIVIRIDKPLTRGLQVRNSNGKVLWIPIKYERLPNFCYWCGLLGHNFSDCDHKPEDHDGTKWPYDAMLRAPFQRDRMVSKGFSMTPKSATEETTGSNANGQSSNKTERERLVEEVGSRDRSDGPELEERDRDIVAENDDTFPSLVLETQVQKKVRCDINKEIAIQEHVAKKGWKKPRTYKRKPMQGVKEKTKWLLAQDRKRKGDAMDMSHEIYMDIDDGGMCKRQRYGVSSDDLRVEAAEQPHQGQ